MNFEHKHIHELSKDLIFISNSQEVLAMKNSLGFMRAILYNSFFVKQDEGELVEVWGMIGIIPDCHKIAYRVI
jgi:hypothetical protein